MDDFTIDTKPYEENLRKLECMTKESYFNDISSFLGYKFYDEYVIEKNKEIGMDNLFKSKIDFLINFLKDVAERKNEGEMIAARDLSFKSEICNMISLSGITKNIKL